MLRNSNEKSNEFEVTFKSVISQMPGQLQNISDYIIAIVIIEAGV